MSSKELYTRHDRLFRASRFVYPVLSRRAGGLSIGVNLNPDKVCNFDCIYCQIDRTEHETDLVQAERLVKELDDMLSLVTSGEIYETDEFRRLPAPLRRLNDIAFSGDGEPTMHKQFDQMVAACAAVRHRHQLGDVKMVLITNASRFHRPYVRRGLETLAANNGVIWAKLEAGTEDYYRKIARTTIPFRRILDNIREAARVWPLVIQSLFMRIHGQPPTRIECEAFCTRLNEITAAGGSLRSVQIYTVARRPAAKFVSPLNNDEIDALVELVKHRTGLATTGYYGASW